MEDEKIEPGDRNWAEKLGQAVLMRIESLRFSRKKIASPSPWGPEKEKTEAYPAETYRLKLLKMPKSIVSRRWFTGGGMTLSFILSILCVVGEAGLISVFFLLFGLISFDYYRFLGRIRVEP